MIKISILDMSLKITNSSLQLHLQGPVSYLIGSDGTHVVVKNLVNISSGNGNAAKCQHNQMGHREHIKLKMDTDGGNS